jgi:PAS domain S-box-containing protein
MRCVSDGQLARPEHSELLKMTIDNSAEILRLRAAVADILALSTIPAVWVGKDPPAIAADLVDVLIESLQLDFAFVRLCEPTGCQAVEMMRGDSWKAFPEWLQQRLALSGQISRNEIVTKVGGVEESCCGIVIPIGLNGERGLIAVACDRSDFPDEIDQQLLSVAANSAAIAFQNASLISELRSAQEALRGNEQERRRARDELEIKVTERAAELQRSEAYLAEAQRLSHTGSFGWKPDTGEIVWSDETYRIFEFDKGVKLTMESLVQRVHPEDRADFQKIVDGASAGVTQFEHTYRLLLPDGRVKHVHALAHLLKDASGNRDFVGAATDVTERKRAEQRLLQSEAYLAEAQRLSQTGSWAWSPDQDIRYWSDECYRVLSFDPQNGLPRFEDFFQRLHPDDQPGFRELIQTAIREKAEWEADYRIVHPDGPVRDVHVVGHPVLSTSGHLVEFVGTVIDTTERKQAEEAVREAQATLAHLARVMTMGELASSIAHEVNQPLAAVVTNGNASLRWLAAEPPNIDEAQECARRIVRDGKRAADVIARIRMLAKRSTPIKAPVDLNDAIQEVLAMINAETRQQQVAVRTELAAGLPQVSADRVQLQQVLLNLTMNALDAMKGITDRRRELFIRSHTDPAGVCAAVQDTGIGLDPQSMERLFQVFYTTKPSGMGLGLAISRTIIEAHGGRLWVASNSGGGVTFQFTLPTARETGE